MTITRKRGPKGRSFQHYSFTSSQTGLTYVARRMSDHWDLHPTCGRHEWFPGYHFYYGIGDLCICDSWYIAKPRLLRDVPAAIEKFEKKCTAKVRVLQNPRKHDS